MKRGTTSHYPCGCERTMKNTYQIVRADRGRTDLICKRCQRKRALAYNRLNRDQSHAAA